MDKDFLYKLVEHGIRQRVEILVLVNQGNKLLRRFPALLIAGNGLFQFRDFRIEGVLLFGVLCVQGLIPGVRQLAQGVVLIDFANQPSSSPAAFGRRPAVSASWICRRSAGRPAFPGRCG